MSTRPRTPEQKAARNAAEAAKRAADPVYTEQMREYHREYNRRPEVREKCRARSRLRTSATRTEHMLRHRYGLTTQTRQELLDSQGGGCKICGRSLEFRRGFDNCGHVDHCHATGRVRGILCARCNTTLGRFDDSADVFLRMAAYLETGGQIS